MLSGVESTLRQVNPRQRPETCRGDDFAGWKLQLQPATSSASSDSASKSVSGSCMVRNRRFPIPHATRLTGIYDCRSLKHVETLNIPVPRSVWARMGCRRCRFMTFLLFSIEPRWYTLQWMCKYICSWVWCYSPSAVFPCTLLHTGLRTSLNLHSRRPHLLVYIFRFIQHTVHASLWLCVVIAFVVVCLCFVFVWL